MSFPLRSTCLATVACLAVAVTGCGPGYLDHGEKVPATEVNKQVFEVVKAYHAAVEAKDIDTIKGMISQRYHENAGTTDRGEDDYGYDKVLERIVMLRDNVKRVQLRLKLLGMNVGNGEATVDYEFAGRVLLSEGGLDSYKTWNDVSRMRLAREQDRWMIVGGL